MSSRRVLAATDLSEPADEALRQASEWARLRGAQLIVCHVVPSLVGSRMLFPQLLQKEAMAQPPLEARAGEAVRERTAAVTGRGPEDFEVVITAGTPYAEVLRQAEALAVDLVVVGSHTRTGLVSVFLGNVAEEVVRHAHASVLVARPCKQRGLIVVATDLSEAADVALRAAAEQARLAGARIALMYSIHKELEPVLAMSSFGSGYQFVEDERTELRKKGDEKLRELLARAGIAGDPIVTEGDPAAELAECAIEHGAELAVVGATGRTALRRLHLGRVAERVARHVPCSVLVARAV
jgi:nucleotide-binding universal stress UspA family protein